MLCLLFLACTSQESRPAPKAPPRPARPAPAAPVQTTGALEVHVSGPAVAARPKLERPKGCIDDAPVEAAPAGPLANAVVWIDRGTAPPRTAKITWSGCRPSDTAVALTPRSAIAVHNADATALEIGITPWPGSTPPASWRTLPPGATAGVAFPKDPGLYLLVDKAHDWAKVLVAIGPSSGESSADGIVRLPDVPVGEAHVHVAHPDLERVIDLLPAVAVGRTTIDVDLGATTTAPPQVEPPAPSDPG